MAYGMTSTDLLYQCQDRTLEPESTVAFASTMWTIPEVLQYLSNRCMEYQRQVGLVVKHYGYWGDALDGLPTTPQEERVALPKDTIDILRLAFINFPVNPNLGSAWGSGAWGAGPWGGAINGAGFSVTELPREDSWSLDNSNAGWEISEGATPNAYNETIPGVISVMLSNPSNDIGQLDLLSIEITAALTAVGMPLGLPDECTCYIVYGALEDMLRRAGEPQDSARADYCAGRWEEGVQLGLALLAQPLTESLVS